jgi:hypothetical protein
LIKKITGKLRSIVNKYGYILNPYDELMSNIVKLILMDGYLLKKADLKFEK